MAESRRKADAKKGAKAEPTEAEQAQRTRLERMTLLLIVGMIVLSEFLSEGKPSKNVLLTAGILFGILLVGVAFTWLARRKASGPVA
jgi:hypothetical protein